MNLHSKMKIYILLMLGIILVISSVTIVNNNLNIKMESSSGSNSDNENLKISKIFGKIHINNNWSDAKAAGICTGSGTESDPYVIENLEIDGGGSGSCILIENSNEFFKIDSCSVSNWGDGFYDAGIKLISVYNGDLLNNNATNQIAYGIILEESCHNLLVNNVIDSRTGIRFFYSNSNVVYLNNFAGFFYDLEYRQSSNNKFNTPKKMIYYFNDKKYTKYLGNFWNDFNEVDNDNNGIADNALILDKHLPSGQWVYVDYYPLMQPFQNYEIIEEASSDGVIPGYNLFLLIGIISIITIFLLHKLKKP